MMILLQYNWNSLTVGVKNDGDSLENNNRKTWIFQISCDPCGSLGIILELYNNLIAESSLSTENKNNKTQKLSQ